MPFVKIISNASIQIFVGIILLLIETPLLLLKNVWRNTVLMQAQYLGGTMTIVIKVNKTILKTVYFAKVVLRTKVPPMRLLAQTQQTPP